MSPKSEKPQVDVEEQPTNTAFQAGGTIEPIDDSPPEERPPSSLNPTAEGMSYGMRTLALEPPFVVERQTRRLRIILRVRDGNTAKLKTSPDSSENYFLLNGIPLQLEGSAAQGPLYIDPVSTPCIVELIEQFGN